MTDAMMYQCPNCGTDIAGKLQGGGEVRCVSCNKAFRVMLDGNTGGVAFVEIDAQEAPEPLFLPRGSVRAVVTVVMAACCWIMVFAGNEVPGYLLSLLATIIGYYFGFRKTTRAAYGRMFDSSTQAEKPLFLPTGFIRCFLIAGFLVSGCVLYLKGRLRDPDYLQFFVVLFGFVVGYVFAKCMARYERRLFYVAINHVKGVLVLAGAAYLVYLLISGLYLNAEHLALVLASGVSFYFGSRS